MDPKALLAKVNQAAWILVDSDFPKVKVDSKWLAEISLVLTDQQNLIHIHQLDHQRSEPMAELASWSWLPKGITQITTRPTTQTKSYKQHR